MDAPRLVNHLFTKLRPDVEGFSYRTHVFADGTLVEHFAFPDGDGLWNVSIPNQSLLVDPRLDRYPASTTLLLAEIVLQFCV